MDELFDKNLRREISLHETEEMKILKERDENSLMALKKNSKILMVLNIGKIEKNLKK